MQNQNRQTLQVYEALLRISRAVQEMERASDLAHVVQVFYSQLKALSLDFCALSLHRIVDKKQCLFENHLVKPDDSYQVEIAIRKGLYEEWKSGKRIYRSDLSSDPTILFDSGYLNRLEKRYGVPIRSLLHMPHSGGMLTLRSSSIDPFTPDDIKLVHWVSEVLSIGLLRVRDLEEAGRSAAETKAIIETVLDGIIVIDAKGFITSINPAAVEIFGYAKHEILGQNVSMLMPDPPSGDHETFLSNYLRTGKAKITGIGREVVGLRKDGSVFPMELAISEMQHPNERAFVGIVRDITEKKQAEVALLRAKEDAERANRLKREFLANVGHEIRTPMNGILGMTHLALDTDLTEEQHDYLTTVKGSAEHLLNLLNEILDLSKIEAQKLALDSVVFNFEDCVVGSIRALSALAEKKGLSVTSAIDADVPNFVIGDPGRLQQILMNLIGNGVKFTTAGEVAVCVEKEEQASTRCQLLFSVSDTGIGIAPEQCAAIFEAFSQADGSSTRRFGGTGLGLAVSSHLVKLMDGEIWVESEEGKGSTFYFKAWFDVPENVDVIRDDAGKIPMFDREKTLKNLAGDEMLLAELAELFRKNYPEKLANIRKAIDARDADALAEAGHVAKGMVGNFAAQKCFDAARNLEIMGKDWDFDGAKSEYEILVHALKELDTALPKI